jgi:6-phosphogluconolactonase
MSTTKVVPGILIATPGAGEVAREAAIRMAKAIRDAVEARGRAAIALSGGNTPREAYGLLAVDRSVDWSKVDVFWVDERAVDPTDDRSNYHHAKTKLIDVARIPPERVHRMPADAPDLAAAARVYEGVIRARVLPDEEGVPSFDLVVLGVGDDGHTASLFPGDPAVRVMDRLVVDVPAKGAREARLTITAPVIEAARSVVVLAVGRAKNAPLEGVWLVEGDTEQTPARVIRGVRGAITWIIDRAAGGLDG